MIHTVYPDKEKRGREGREGEGLKGGGGGGGGNDTHCIPSQGGERERGERDGEGRGAMIHSVHPAKEEREGGGREGGEGAMIHTIHPAKNHYPIYPLCTGTPHVCKAILPRERESSEKPVNIKYTATH